MAAIFRVKRRNDDEPLDALFVACKRRKTDSDEDIAAASLSGVIKFAGTVKDQDENALEHITKKLNKEELKTNFKQHAVDIMEKVRKETKEASANSRFKVVNFSRALDDSKTDDPDVEEITVIDIEDTASCTTARKDSGKKDDYVYDLYYTNEQHKDFDFEDLFLDAVQTAERFVYDPVTEMNSDEESENSNSESNWKNEYPDSDHSENSILEDEMREAVERLKIEGEDSDLSSEDDLDYDKDVADQYGSVYAKYKARILKEWDNENSDSSKQESSESEGMGDFDDD